MIRFVYHMLLTANSIVLLVIIYIVKEKLFIQKLGELFSIILYTLLPIILTYLCIKLSSFLQNDRTNINLERIELANDAYLPSYLGYFFVALSIPTKDTTTLFFIFFIIFIFIFCSQALYYNPLFLIFGYKFYYVINSKKMKIFIISKREINGDVNLIFENLKRINDYTFIDKEVN